MQSCGTAAPMFAWNSGDCAGRPSAQLTPGLWWQTAHSIPVTPVTETPPMVTGAAKVTLWSIGCRSDPAFITMPVGRIWTWQSVHRLVGCGSGVMAPPGVAE